MIFPLLLVLAGGQARDRPPQRPDAAATSLVRLPARVAGDFRRLATRTPLFVLAAGAAAAAAAHPADAAIVRGIGTSEVNSRVFDAGAELGDGFVQSGAAVVVFVVGLASRSPRTQAVGSELLESQIVEGAIAQGVKHAVLRRRPDGGRYSFPSGHASAAFATADVLVREFGWKAGLPAYAAAAWIGASRVAQRRHYLSDTIAGAAIGVASARAIDIHARGRRVTIAPTPLPRGAAVFIVVSPRYRRSHEAHSRSRQRTSGSE